MDNRVFTRLGAGALCLAWQRRPSRWTLDRGVDDKLASNIEIYLDDLEASQYHPERLEAEVRRLAAEALRPFGYYEPSLTVRFDDPEAPSHVELEVDKGEPVRIDRLNFVLQGAAADDAPFTEAIEAIPRRKGGVAPRAL